ncbi:MAG: glycoside hydrolase family 25 protein [Chromatiales bacterium]|nr:glycoside hydrolase family 25 protein [Chromatiales bacterium]
MAFSIQRYSIRMMIIALIFSVAFGAQSHASQPLTGLKQRGDATGEKMLIERSQTAKGAARLHKGIDVSGHSGTVDWAALMAKGYSFAFVKATEGVDLEDSSFDDHWLAMKQAGIIRGAYHFYVTEDDPHEQAQFFIDTVVLDPGDLAPVVDIELIGHGKKPGLSQRFKTWLDLIEKRYGVKPIIYTTAKFWNEHLSSEFGGYPLWIAEYEVEKPSLPNGWSTWHLWQWKGDANVPGVEKGADLNRSNNNGVDLLELIIPH